MTRGAAFFDLDRTLLAYGLFNVVGETEPPRARARPAAALVEGRSAAAVRAAAAAVAPQLAARVQPFATRLFAGHRAAGRPIVLTTTTPYDLVVPFADALGLDGVVTTRYGIDSSGAYDGGIDGPFVWSTGKLDAVRSYAEEHDIDLAESYAYSDSVYDSPLLAAVGNPVAVNPDPRLVLMAISHQWPVLHLDVPPGVQRSPTVGVGFQRAVLTFMHPALLPFARFDLGGEELVPASGPGILVANHRSYFDPVAMALLIARTGRTVRFLGKREVFDAPVVGQIMSAMGGIRVERGTGSDEPLQAAAEALESGDLVALMPEGTIPRGPAFFDPKLTGRWGAARLAAMTKAPVIPIGLWGTERVWPRSARFPNVLNVFDPPLVSVTVGDVVALKYRSPDADTRRIMTAISALLPAASRVKRTPTAEELASTYPPNHRGDSARDPGGGGQAD